VFEHEHSTIQYLDVKGSLSWRIRYYIYSTPALNSHSFPPEDLCSPFYFLFSSIQKKSNFDLPSVRVRFLNHQWILITATESIPKEKHRQHQIAGFQTLFARPLPPTFRGKRAKAEPPLRHQRTTSHPPSIPEKR